MLAANLQSCNLYPVAEKYNIQKKRDLNSSSGKHLDKFIIGFLRNLKMNDTIKVLTN